MYSFPHLPTINWDALVCFKTEPYLIAPHIQNGNFENLVEMTTITYYDRFMIFPNTNIAKTPFTNQGFGPSFGSPAIDSRVTGVSISQDYLTAPSFNSNNSITSGVFA